MSNNPNNKHFGILVFIAFVWAVMVVGCLTKNKKEMKKEALINRSNEPIYFSFNDRKLDTNAVYMIGSAAYEIDKKRKKKVKKEVHELSSNEKDIDFADIISIVDSLYKKDTVHVYGYVSYVTPQGIKTERALMVKCHPKHEFPYVISITANSRVIDITKQYTFTPDSELQPKDTNNLFIGSHLPSHSTGNICEYHKTNNKPCDTLH